MPAHEIARRTDEAMALLGLTHLARRNCRHLSGGETQRVVLAGALAMRPKLLILDEPMTDLDQQTRDALVRHLHDLPWQMAMVFLDVAAQPWMRGWSMTGLPSATAPCCHPAPATPEAPAISGQPPELEHDPPARRSALTA